MDVYMHHCLGTAADSVQRNYIHVSLILFTACDIIHTHNTVVDIQYFLYSKPHNPCMHLLFEEAIIIIMLDP